MLTKLHIARICHVFKFILLSATSYDLLGEKLSQGPDLDLGVLASRDDEITLTRRLRSPCHIQVLNRQIVRTLYLCNQTATRKSINEQLTLFGATCERFLPHCTKDADYR